MPRAHPSMNHQQTTADQQEYGGGCLLGFLLPPISVLMVSTVLASIVLREAPVVLSTGPSSISPFFTPEVQHWSVSISQWAADFDLDPNLIATVMQIESCGDPRALSPSGAMGLFQVMPFHFQPSDNPYDPETNAARGLAYLAYSLQVAFGDPRLALAGYNGGVGVIQRGESTWSAQTQRYVRYGWPIYRDARNGFGSGDLLLEWYGQYGRGLCLQARQRLGLP